MVFDADRAAQVLADAAAFGDGEAARRWRITKRTVWNYRARLREDKDFAARFSALIDEHEAELGAMRVRFLRKAMAEMERRLGKEETTIEGIAECVRVVGELHQFAAVMEDDEGSDGCDAEAGEASASGADGSFSTSAAQH